MSANRSVQAAQRRRAGPTDNVPNIPGRGPQPSINSAQMFANQSKSGQGISMPTGRLAGQQAVMQQQQSQKQGSSDKLSSVSKMTVPHAITLITLRLGAIESKLINFNEGHNINIDDESGVDSGFLQTVMLRLESLEKRSASTSGSVSTPEINLLKQQFETVKQTLVQTKSTTNTIVKENSLLRTQLDILKQELVETKELLSALQNLTMDNSQKILEISFGNNDVNFTNLGDTHLDELENNEFKNLDDDSDQQEIIGADLKELIESNLNSEL